VRVSSVGDAKLAIKQLKLRKKEIANVKRGAQQAINAITAERRDQLARQGRMTRGGGGLGRAIRTFEGLQRDRDKAAHERRLDPFQRQKAALDAHALDVDKVIVQLESYINEQGS
jgi:hypothetical protein